MPHYSYAGTDERGAAASGELEAVGLIEAAELLRARGVWASRLERRSPGPQAEPLAGGDAFSYFNRSLAELAGLGIPLPRAVREIAAGLRRGRFRKALEGVEARLREGVSLEEAIRERPGDFPSYYASMIRAGAESGRLPAVLSAVARNAEGFQQARRALTGALAYPAVVVAFGLLLSVAFLLLFLPAYEEMHRRLGLDNSLTLRALLAVFGSASWQAGLTAAAIAAAFGAYRGLTATLVGERLLFRVPLLGRIRRQLFLARFAGALSLLSRSGVPLARAYPVALGASGSRELGAAAPRLEARAAEGAGLAELLRETPVLPPGAASYLALGERSGRVPEAAEELAELLTERAAGDCETLFLVYTPVALVLTGLLLLFLFMALVAPYYSFLERLGR